MHSIFGNNVLPFGNPLPILSPPVGKLRILVLESRYRGHLKLLNPCSLCAVNLQKKNVGPCSDHTHDYS